MVSVFTSSLSVSSASAEQTTHMSIQDDCIHMGGNHRDEDGDADSCALSQAFMMMMMMAIS